MWTTVWTALLVPLTVLCATFFAVIVPFATFLAVAQVQLERCGRCQRKDRTREILKITLSWYYSFVAATPDASICRRISALAVA